MAWNISPSWNTGDINTRPTNCCAVIDDSGTPKIIAPVQHGVKCFDKDGSLLWTYASITNGYDVRHIATGNLNGTGYNDCTVVCSGYYNTATDGKVAILDKDGNSLTLLRTNNFGGTAPSQTRYAAIDGTDIYISTNQGFHKFVKSGGVWVEDWYKALGECSQIQIHDAGNGKRIYVTKSSTGATLYCYQTDGTEDWNYVSSNGYARLVEFGKLDNTISGEQIIYPFQSSIRILDKDGNLLSTLTPSNVCISVTCFDADGDGIDELYITDMSSAVRCYKRTGINTYTELYNKFNYFPTGIYGGLTHYDINGDGEQELIGAGTDGHIRIYDKTLSTSLIDLTVGHGTAGGWIVSYQQYTNGLVFVDTSDDGHADMVISGSTGYVDVLECSGLEVSGDVSVTATIAYASITSINPVLSAIKNTNIVSNIASISLTNPSPSFTSEKYGYEIEKKIGTGEWNYLSIVEDNIYEYEDNSSFVNGETYWYRVRKVQGAIVESWSNEVSIIYSSSSGDVNTTSPSISLILSSFSPEIKGITNSGVNPIVISCSISTISPNIVGCQNTNIIIPKIDIISSAIIPSISASINIAVLATPTTIQINNTAPQTSVATDNSIPVINTNIIGKSPLVVGSGNNSIIPNYATINVLCQVPVVNGTRNSNISTSSITILNNTKVPNIVGKQNVSINIDNIVIPIQCENPIVLGQINTLVNAPLNYANVYAQSPIIDSSKNTNLQIPTAVIEIHSESPIVETQGSKTVSAAKSTSVINALYPLIIGEKNTLTSLPITSIIIGINIPIIRADKNVSIIPNCINTTLHALSASITTSQGLFVSVPKVSILLENNIPIVSSDRNCFVNVPKTETNILSLTHIIIGKQNKNINVSTVSIPIIIKQPQIRVDDIIHVSSLQSTIVPLDPYITSNRNISNNIVLNNVIISINKPIVIGQINNIIPITKPSIEVNSLQPIVKGITNCDIVPSSLVVDIKTLNPEISSNRNADIQIESASLTIVMISPLVKVILKYTGYKMSVSDVSRNININDYQHGTICSVLNRNITTQISSNKTSIGIKEHGSSIADHDA